MWMVRRLISMSPTPCRRPKFRETSSRTVPSRAASSSLFSGSSNRIPCGVCCPVSSASRKRCAMRRLLTVENDNSSTRLIRCRSLCPRTLKTLRASSGFCRQTLRKLSAGNRSRVVVTAASALAGYRPPSKTGTSAREFPRRSIPISCSRPSGADLNTFTVPSSTISSSWQGSPSEKIVALSS